MPRKDQGWITFQASAEERQILDDYCQRSQRSKTEILRELVRSLEQRDGEIDSGEGMAAGPNPFRSEREEGEYLAVQRDFAISARNLFRGKILAIAPQGVNAELTLAIASGIELVAVITLASIQRMNLAVGKAAYAIIKSNNILIATLPDP